MDYQEYQRSSHLSCANAQTRSLATRQTRYCTDHPTNCQNKPNRLHQDVDYRDQNVHELYPILQKDMVSKTKSVEDIHGNQEESYAKLPKLLEALQCCVPGTMVATQTESVFEGGEIIPGKRMLKRVFWSFGPCINGFVYCKPIVQVDGTWLYGKYIATLLIATTQDGANHIFPIAYAIVKGETTSAWGFFFI